MRAALPATLLGGLGATLGAGVFIGLAPAAVVSGRWLPGGVLVAALLAGAAAATGRPATSHAAPHGASHAAGNVVAAAELVSRLGAAAAVAGACGLYLTPGRPLVGAVTLLVVVAAAEYLVRELPVAVERVAVGVVVAVLAVFVIACFALGSPGNTAATAGLAGADDPAGVPGAAALMSVAFGGPVLSRGRYLLASAVAVVAGAVSLAALYQLGGGRLAVSPVPLRDALAAAAGAQIDGLLTFGVVTGCALVLYHLLAGVRSGLGGLPGVVPGLLTVVAGGLLAVLLTPVTVLAVTAGGVLLTWASRHVALLVRWREEARWRQAVAVAGLAGCVVALVTLPLGVLLWVVLAALLITFVRPFATAEGRR